MITPAQEAMNKVCTTVLHVAKKAAVGYGCACLFTKINPLHSAALFATSALLSALLRPVFNTVFARLDASRDMKFLGELVNHAVSVIAVAGFVSVVGGPMTVVSGAILASYSLAVHLLLGKPAVMHVEEPFAARA